MPPINLNFADVEVPNWDPLPEGMHSLRIIEVKYLPQRGEGNAIKAPGMNIFLAPNVAPSSPDAKKKIFTHISFSEKALWKAKEFFEAVYQRPFDTDNISFDTDDLLGKSVYCELKVADNRYQKKDGSWVEGKKNEIKKFEPDMQNPVGLGLE